MALDSEITFPPIRVVTPSPSRVTALRRHICLWILPSSPFLVSRQSPDLTKQRICHPRIAELQPRHSRRVTWTCTDDGDEGSGKEGKEDKGDNRDWDSSWNEFNEKRNGGVFGLGVESTPQQRQIVDERTERLTSAWSNDVGFLVGIGVIGLIAAFYGYIYASGGIS